MPVEINREAAEALSIEALSFLASDPERLERFLSLSGLDPATIRLAASDPGFLAAVLEHFCTDESLLLAFSANTGRDPADVGKALRVLARFDRDSEP
jgi:hypothetical protein